MNGIGTVPDQSQHVYSEMFPVEYNQRAVQVLERIESKLTGRDFLRPTGGNAVNGFEVEAGANGAGGDEQEAGGEGAGEGQGNEDEGALDTEQQVFRLLQQAMSYENLCQHYIGWCSFW